MDALIILGAVALLALLVIRANVVLAYHWDWSVVGTYLLRTDPKTGELVPNLLLQGFFTTIRLAVWSLLLGTLVGAIGAGLLVYGRPALRWLARCGVELVRDMPPIVLIFVLYFFVSSQLMPLLGLQRLLQSAPAWLLGAIAALLAPPERINDFLSGLACLALLAGAYITEILRAGLQSIPLGQIEAGRALGPAWLHSVPPGGASPGGAQRAAGAGRSVHHLDQGQLAGGADLDPGADLHDHRGLIHHPALFRGVAVHRSAVFLRLLLPVPAVRRAGAALAARLTRIACSIPLDRSGLHVGVLGVPFSDDAHAYGVIPVPIAVLGGARGPTLLISAGVHGDEYEGQIVLRRLLREIDPARLTGRLILLPALNLPAVRVARRCSPIDGANMNRAFPGDPDGGPTAQIAHYVERELLPLCQAALDLHSGGTASEYLPCAYVYAGGPLAEAKTRLAHAFAAPLAVVIGTTAETRSLSAACERAGRADDRRRARRRGAGGYGGAGCSR